ncbi:MAG: hypothetical protein PHS37_07100 [Candidatus Omnitrophica bacterium]|nr:hypothetical protein [Candidatus Omnitrophota bacterium]
MADRPRPVSKKPEEILENVFSGHTEALMGGTENGKKYLLHFLDKFNSIPNAVKFFIYDLLAEDAYQTGDLVLCRQAVERAGKYLDEAGAKTSRQLTEYLPRLRFVERGISVMVDAGEYEKAISFCDMAVKNGLGKAYAAKKASIERMM